MRPAKVFLQNRIVEARKARASVFDHGFLYGDGIYETVRAYHYRVFHWPRHFRRLKQSAHLLQLKCPWSSQFLLQTIGRVLKANQAPGGTVRLSVSRGPGPLGLDPALCPKPTLVMLLHPERPIEAIRAKGVKIGIPQVRRNHPLCLDPRIKSNNALNTILAKMEGIRMGVFETILLNLDGFLTEGTTSNLFFVNKGKLCTPSLSCGLLEGVTREVVLKLARQQSFPVREGRYTLQDLRQADEIFLTSTTLEIVPVVKVVTPAILWARRPGPVAARLQEVFKTYVQKELSL